MTLPDRNRIKHPELYPALKTPDEYADDIKKHCDFVSQKQLEKRAKKLVMVYLKKPPF